MYLPPISKNMSYPQAPSISATPATPSSTLPVKVGIGGPSTPLKISPLVSNDQLLPQSNPCKNFWSSKITEPFTANRKYISLKLLDLLPDDWKGSNWQLWYSPVTQCLQNCTNVYWQTCQRINASTFLKNYLLDVLPNFKLMICRNCMQLFPLNLGHRWLEN